jgi:hypothetical protein
MGLKLKELRSRTEDELIAIHDEAVEVRATDTLAIIRELDRRQTAREQAVLTATAKVSLLCSMISCVLAFVAITASEIAGDGKTLVVILCFVTLASMFYTFEKLFKPFKRDQ